jgi:hypothetical protein
LNLEVLQDQSFRNLDRAQQKFDVWLPVYNLERPHEALGLDTSASRYRPSHRRIRSNCPHWNITSKTSRRVQGKGELYYQGKQYALGQACNGQPVA